MPPTTRRRKRKSPSPILPTFTIKPVSKREKTLKTAKTGRYGKKLKDEALVEASPTEDEELMAEATFDPVGPTPISISKMSLRSMSNQLIPVSQEEEPSAPVATTSNRMLMIMPSKEESPPPEMQPKLLNRKQLTEAALVDSSMLISKSEFVLNNVESAFQCVRMEREIMDEFVTKRNILANALHAELNGRDANFADRIVFERLILEFQDLLESMQNQAVCVQRAYTAIHNRQKEKEEEWQITAVTTDLERKNFQSGWIAEAQARLEETITLNAAEQTEYTHLNFEKKLEENKSKYQELTKKVNKDRQSLASENDKLSRSIKNLHSRLLKSEEENKELKLTIQQLTGTKKTKIKKELKEFILPKEEDEEYYEKAIKDISQMLDSDDESEFENVGEDFGYHHEEVEAIVGENKNLHETSVEMASAAESKDFVICLVKDLPEENPSDFEIPAAAASSHLETIEEEDNSIKFNFHPLTPPLSNEQEIYLDLDEEPEKFSFSDVQFSQEEKKHENVTLSPQEHFAVVPPPQVPMSQQETQELEQEEYGTSVNQLQDDLQLSDSSDDEEPAVKKPLVEETDDDLEEPSKYQAPDSDTGNFSDGTMLRKNPILFNKFRRIQNSWSASKAIAEGKKKNGIEFEQKGGPKYHLPRHPPMGPPALPRRGAQFKLMAPVDPKTVGKPCQKMINEQNQEASKLRFNQNNQMQKYAPPKPIIQSSKLNMRIPSPSYSLNSRLPTSRATNTKIEQSHPSPSPSGQGGIMPAAPKQRVAHVPKSVPGPAPKTVTLAPPPKPAPFAPSAPKPSSLKVSINGLSLKPLIPSPSRHSRARSIPERFNPSNPPCKPVTTCQKGRNLEMQKESLKRLRNGEMLMEEKKKSPLKIAVPLALVPSRDIARLRGPSGDKDSDCSVLSTEEEGAGNYSSSLSSSSNDESPMSPPPAPPPMQVQEHFVLKSAIKTLLSEKEWEEIDKNKNRAEWQLAKKLVASYVKENKDGADSLTEFAVFGGKKQAYLARGVYGYMVTSSENDASFPNRKQEIQSIVNLLKELSADKRNFKDVAALIYEYFLTQVLQKRFKFSEIQKELESRLGLFFGHLIPAFNIKDGAKNLVWAALAYGTPYVFALVKGMGRIDFQEFAHVGQVPLSTALKKKSILFYIARTGMQPNAACRRPAQSLILDSYRIEVPDVQYDVYLKQLVTAVKDLEVDEVLQEASEVLGVMLSLWGQTLVNNFINSQMVELIQEWKSNQISNGVLAAIIRGLGLMCHYQSAKLDDLLVKTMEKWITTLRTTIMDDIVWLAVSEMELAYRKKLHAPSPSTSTAQNLPFVRRGGNLQQKNSNSTKKRKRSRPNREQRNAAKKSKEGN